MRESPRHTQREKDMKQTEKLIEISGLLDNLLKVNNDRTVLQNKVLLFCYVYQSLPFGVIIDKLGMKKTNFAIMIADLEKDGFVSIKKSNIDRRCKLVELTEKGKKELDKFIKDVEKSLGNTPLEVDKAIETLSAFLNKIV